MSATVSAAPIGQSSKVLPVALWIAQLVLAAMFGMAGVMKLTAPIAVLAQNMVWPGDVPAALVRVIGASELSGALGLLLPSLTRIKPALTPLAAAGLAVIMLLAAIFHIARGEGQMVPVNVALGAVAAFVAWGRLTRARIAPR
jgi:putative oxidoreductase